MMRLYWHRGNNKYKTFDLSECETFIARRSVPQINTQYLKTDMKVGKEEAMSFIKSSLSTDLLCSFFFIIH